MFRERARNRWLHLLVSFMRKHFFCGADETVGLEIRWMKNHSDITQSGARAIESVCNKGRRSFSSSWSWNDTSDHLERWTFAQLQQWCCYEIATWAILCAWFVWRRVKLAVWEFPKLEERLLKIYWMRFLPSHSVCLLRSWHRRRRRLSEVLFTALNKNVAGRLLSGF